MQELWRKCSTCKKPLPFGGKHWVCNVSTCNRSRIFLAFCSVNCWDGHLGVVRHRESWAEERDSPTEDQWKKVLSGEDLWPPRKPKAAEPVQEAVPMKSESFRVILRKK